MELRNIFVIVFLQIILVVTACPEEDDHERYCENGYLWHEGSGQCHKFRERGPCGRREILEVTECNDSRGICIPRICQQEWVYHNKTRKCYEHVTKGPCGRLAYIVKIDYGRHNQLGRCQCEHEVCNLDRPRVYWDRPYRCYHIFDQGPCEEGEWLVPNSNTTAICERCPCWEAYLTQKRPPDMQATSASPDEDRSYLFSHGGKCYRTIRKGFPGCPRGQKVYFDAHADHFQPLCDPDPAGKVQCVLSGGVTQRVPCEDGSQPDGYGGCNPVGDF